MAASTASNTLVIVESPTKARTIEKFLPKGYDVIASVGHVRDLPDKENPIPKKFKKEPWARLGVNIEDGFAPLYLIPKGRKKFVSELRSAAKKADHVYFATDEDREGESISWHLLDVLGPNVSHQRLVFHEITRTAIQEALENPREIDRHLVDAQETRRVVDRLYGYEVSPLLWRKMTQGLSAGRVQSVAIRLLVERERERIRFKSASFWGAKAEFSKDGRRFEGELLQWRGRTVAVGRDFDPDTGQLQAQKRDAPLLLAEKEAREIEAMARASRAQVASVENKPFVTAPQAPYVTSTLQQEANSKMRWTARHTMRVAQDLYQNGFITYMRTDSTVLSDEAKSAARDLIVERFGQDYLSESVRYYRNKVKNAQEAHEAIRPAGGQFRAVDEVRDRLGEEAAKLYQMIWRRTLASQMKDARGTNSVALIDIGDARFRARGKTIEFAGFLRAYSADTGEEPDPKPADQDAALPPMTEGDAVAVESVEASERRTKPPQRFTEGRLIRELETRGIGRPSTWASIVDLVQSRAYAFRRDSALVPTFTAIAVVGLLEKHFSQLADYEFTAELENRLDLIARGELGRLDYLNGFYFGNGHKGLHALVVSGNAEIDPREVCGIPIGTTADGIRVEVRVGKYGLFVSNGSESCTLPEDTAPDELDVEKATEMLRLKSQEDEPLGHDPETSQPVYVKQGRFGPYVQRGDSKDEGGFKRASPLPGMEAAELNLETALELLSLPRVLGRHPADGGEVVATSGRFGGYVQWGDETRSIPQGGSPLDIKLEEALKLLKEEKTGRGRSRTKSSKPLRELGKHPTSEKDLKVFQGIYGPYVTDGEINASLPKDSDPQKLTIDQAVTLLQDRADRIAADGGRKRPRRRRRS